MHHFETVLALLVGVTFLALVEGRLDVSTSALRVACGVLVAVFRGLPVVQFDPQLVFHVFMPPLLYRASLLASSRDVRASLRPILLLGVGHVLFVTIVVAWVARLTVPGLPWASAFALGAVVSPPDVAAATAFLRRLPLPRRLVIILEGESMINDAAAIVAYRMAVAAAVTGAFSLTAASLRFLYVGAGGVVVGLAVGWLLAELRRHIHDPEVENTISLLTGYAAYLPAEHLGVSGILAVVATGLYLGRVGPRVVAADTRVQNSGMWDVVVFALEGLIFIITGLALRPILGGWSGPFARDLAWGAVLGSPAGGGVARARGRDSHVHRHGGALSRARRDHRDHVCRHPRDAAGSGIRARAPAPLVGSARDRRAGRTRRDRRPAAHRGGGAGPARRAHAGDVDAPRRVGAHARPLPPSRPSPAGARRRRDGRPGGSQVRRPDAAGARAARGGAARAAATAGRGHHRRRGDATRAARDRLRGAAAS